MAGKKTIWVVDDDPAIRELVTFMVTEAGYEVDAFASGAEVLASSGEPPDAILLDLMMPEVDGVEVLKEVSRRHPKLPVIMVTADHDVRVELLELGAHQRVELMNGLVPRIPAADSMAVRLAETTIDVAGQIVVVDSGNTKTIGVSEFF